MRDILLLILILLLFLFSLRSAYVSCLTYWWFSIFRPQDYAHGDITAFHLPLIATGIFFIGSVLRGHKPFSTDAIGLMMLLFYFLGAIASFTVGCDSTLKPIEPLEYLALLIVAVFLTVSIVKTLKQLVGLILVVSISLGFYSGKGGIHAILSGGAVNYGAENLGGTFTGSNAYAMGTAVLVFFLLFLFRNVKDLITLKLLPEQAESFYMLIKGILFLIVVDSIYNVVSLFSRGSAIALFCGFFLLLMLSSKKAKALMVIVPLVLVLAIAVPIPENYKSHIASAFSETEELDASAASRPYFWGVANSIVKDHPIGVGFNCYRYYYNFYRTGPEDAALYRDVHSSHFNAFADAGYAGLIVWLSIFLLAAKRLFRLRKIVTGREDKESKIFVSMINATLCSQTVFFLGGSFYTLTYMDLIWWIWGLTMILTLLIDKSVNVQSEKST